jgi:hypothetical protein
VKIGRPSTLFPNSGLYVEHLGSSDKPILLRIYGEDDKVLATLTQEKGKCIDPGHVDFFMGPNCRPAVHEQVIVEILPDGRKISLHRDPEFLAGHRDAWISFLREWLTVHGRKT